MFQVYRRSREKAGHRWSQPTWARLGDLDAALHRKSLRDLRKEAKVMVM